MSIGEQIRKYRIEAGLTQEKLAEALGVTVGAVSKWENGNNTPDIVMLGILAEKLHLGLFRESGNEE